MCSILGFVIFVIKGIFNCLINYTRFTVPYSHFIPYGKPPLLHVVFFDVSFNYIFETLVMVNFCNISSSYCGARRKVKINYLVIVLLYENLLGWPRVFWFNLFSRKLLLMNHNCFNLTALLFLIPYNSCTVYIVEIVGRIFRPENTGLTANKRKPNCLHWLPMMSSLLGVSLYKTSWMCELVSRTKLCEFDTCRQPKRIIQPESNAKQTQRRLEYWVDESKRSGTSIVGI